MVQACPLMMMITGLHSLAHRDQCSVVAFSWTLSTLLSLVSACIFFALMKARLVVAGLKLICPLIHQSMATMAQDDNDFDLDWECPHHHKNQHCIGEPMSFVEGRTDDPFPRNKTHTKVELLSLCPSHVKRHLLFKAHPDPCPALCWSSLFTDAFDPRIKSKSNHSKFSEVSVCCSIALMLHK